MANQYKNKVVYNGTTLIDLSQDTVTNASHILKGYVGHLADGTQVTGTAESGGGSVTWETMADQTYTITTYNGMRIITINGYDEPLSADETYRITWGDTQYICNTIVDSVGFTQDGYFMGNPSVFGSQYEDTGEPFALYRTSSTRMIGRTNDTASSVYVKIEKQVPASSGGITPTGTVSITTNGTHDVTNYASASVSVTPNLQSKSATPTTSSQTVSPDNGYDGLSSVTIGAIPSQYIVPTGNKVITENGNNIDVAEYATVSVNVSGGSTEEWDTLYDGSSTIRTDSVNYLTFSSTDTMNAGDIYKVTWRGVSTILAAKNEQLMGGTYTIIGNPGIEPDGTDDGSGLTYYGYKYNSSTFAFGTTDETGTISLKVEKLISGSVTPSETLKITENGIYDVTNYTKANVNIPTGGGSSMNTQTVQSTTRRNNTSLGSITSLTCSTAGTYDVYWSCARSSTSGTWGSRLYINGTAYGTENTTFSNHVQNNHLTGVTIPANATVAIYGRSRSGYYIYVPQLTIEQTA